MHLFVFQPPKLRLNIYDPRYRNLSSTRGQFELKEMRKATRGAIEIFGYGTHPLHVFLKEQDQDKFLKGHILAVEDASAAMWLKLNNDTVVKSGVKYLASYHGIDMDYLRELGEEANVYAKTIEVSNSFRYSANTLAHSLNNIFRGVSEGDHPYLKASTVDACQRLNEMLQSDLTHRDAETKLAREKLQQVRSLMVSYIKSCGLDSVSRK